MKKTSPFLTTLLLALAIPGLVIPPNSFASLTLYDAEIDSDHGGGAGSLPYAAVLTEPAVFDGLNATAFDFGALTGPATIELIIEGDPDAGGQNGYIGRADANPANSLRYEQWDNTGTLGFTRGGVADYDLGVPSPTVPTHVVYRWDGVDTMDLFIDGTLSGTTSGATFEMPTGAGLLGNVSDGGGEGLLGTIHRITTYDSALADAAIESHANAWLASGDPSIGVPLNVDLIFDGSVQTFDLNIQNGGEANVLTITTVDVGGADAGKFAINTALPLDINPGEQGTVEFTFDPMGAAGEIAATLTVNSNDLLNPMANVQLSGLIRDPQIAVAAALDFGSTTVPVTQMLEVQNVGSNQALTLALNLTGPGADKFSVTGPASIPAGSSDNIEITFTPGDPGGSSAQLEITTNDPGNGLALVALTATTPVDEVFLTSYDAVIAADHGNGTGPIPHQAVLTVPAEFDTTNSSAFDFGTVTGDATFEFILQGDPVDGGQDGFLAVAENPLFSLRYEQWDDTGALGFTHGGVEDYLFTAADDETLLNSPTSPTHVAYLWQSALQTMQLYIGGALAGSHTGSSFEMPTGQGVIGNNPGGTEGMLGTIHRVTIYNSDIGAVNVMRHANAFITGTGASDFQIISITPPQDDLLTFVWNSTPGIDYAVDRSYDLITWQELDDGVPSQGSTTTYSTSSVLPEGLTRVYFRARRP